MSKELFLKNTELAKSWRSVTHGDVFDKVLIYARSEIAQGAPTRDDLRGAELMAHTLMTLADAEETGFEWPSSGLQHQAEVMPDKTKPKRKK